MLDKTTAELLNRAASTKMLADVKALFVFPGAVLAPTQRGGVKHHSQVVSAIRRFSQWPALPLQELETRVKHERKDLGTNEAKEKEVIRAKTERSRKLANCFKQSKAEPRMLMRWKRK